MSGPVEKRGIDLVPADHRYGKPRDLFFLWAGTTTNIFTVSYGALLVIGFGMTFWQAFIAIVVGNLLAFPLLALTSLQGPTTGTTTMTISRASFGWMGARFNGFLSWLMLIGFEAGGLVLVYYSVQALFGRMGIAFNGVTQIIAIVVLGLIQMLLPFFGHKLLMTAQKYATYLFTVAFIAMAFLIIPQVQTGAEEGASFDLPLMISAIALVMASGGLSWAPSGANFSRYLPKDSNPKSVGLWAAMGGFVPYILLQTLGAAMATVVVPDGTDLSDPLAIPAILPVAFAIPFLILVGIGLMLQNSTNLYSSSLNLQVAGITAPRWLMVIIDTVICITVTIAVVSQSSFYDILNAFIASLGIWLAPWVAIYLIDWWMRRGEYNLRDLEEKGRGTNIPGVISLAAGMVAAALFANTGYLVGPLTALLSPADPSYAPDLSILVGVLVGGLLYAVLNKTLSPANAADASQNNQTQTKESNNA
jgi:Purine-cytosine permease and related proteins